MNYIGFKKRALLTQVYNLLFIESAISIETTVTVNAVTVDSVPFIVIMAGQATLSAAIETFTAVSMDATINPEFTLEAVLNLLEAVTTQIEITDDVTVVANLLTFTAEKVDSTIPVTITVGSNAGTHEGITVQTEIELASTFSCDIETGELLPGATVAMSAELAFSIIAVTASVIAAQITITGINELNAEITQAETIEIYTNVEMDGSLGVLFSLCYSKPLTANITATGTLAVEMKFAPLSVIDDYASNTLDSIGGWTIDRFSIKI